MVGALRVAYMHNAVIVDAVRTPIGRRDGGLKTVHPEDLAAATIEAVIERQHIDGRAIGDVILGCVTQTGEQSSNIARSAALSAGLPESVGGITIDRQASSSLAAIGAAQRGVEAGAYDVVVAGGVESMTRVPSGSDIYYGPGRPFGSRMRARYEMVPPGVAAQQLATKHGFGRTLLDDLSAESHDRAMAAAAARSFAAETIAVETNAGQITADECVTGASREELAAFPPSFDGSESITAGNTAAIGDGAAALLIADDRVCADLDLTPAARFVAYASSGCDPQAPFDGVVPVTQQVLERAGLALSDVGRFEIHESFASVVAYWLEAFGDGNTQALWSRTNVRGGAIALGDPIGASAARSLTTLVHELRRSGDRFGMVVTAGGGDATACIIETITS